MNPVSQASDSWTAASDFVPFDATVAVSPRPARSTVAGWSTTVLHADELAIGALLRFKSLMAADGQTVHLARLCYDKLYAYERIAAAHASSDEDLRRLALELFQIYHRRACAGMPSQ